MIVIPYFLMLLFLVAVLFDTRKAILLAVIIRPIVDCFYEGEFALVGLKPTEYLGVLMPTLIFLKIIFSSKHSFTKGPLSLLWILFFYFQLFGIVLIVTVGGDIMLGFSSLFRAFNGFIGFYLFQEFFNSKKEFRILLIAHIIAGLFPLCMSVYQNIFGGLLRSESTIGELTRNIGLYHDAYTLRYYAFQTLAAIILYWSYFINDIKVISRAVVLALSAAVILTIYKIYSKAGYLILAEWLLVWNSARKNLGLGILFILLLSLGLTMNGNVSQLLSTVYSKEVGAVQGKEKAARLFQGRVGNWKNDIEKFAHQSIVLKLVGDGSAHTDAHNDFLRVLFSNGIFGLLLYLVLLSSIAVRCIYNCFKEASPLNVMALMLIGMWFIDAIGLVPGAYPGYQIFVWGFIGLALRGISDLNETEKLPYSRA
jgi:hypothetical protein